MPTAAQPKLKAGRVYRTRDLAAWGANPTRLAKRLLDEGRLRQLAHGLFYSPEASRFGPVPPEDTAIMRAFLGDDDFLITGPPRWNALGLGATATFPVTLVYNRKRSGEFTFGGRRFLLRRVGFPRSPSAEWFATDLLEHYDMAGLSLSQLEKALVRALATGRFDRGRLEEMARGYATKSTQALVERTLSATAQ